MAITAMSFGQTISESKVDDFTGRSVKRTSWDKINNPGHVIYTRVSKIDSSYILGLKITRSVPHGQVFAMAKDASVMFKVEDGSIVDLKNSQHTVTGLGHGSVGLVGSSCYGIDIQCFIDESDLITFKSKKIIKIRFYTTEGYVEYDLKEKFSDIIQKQVSLF